MSAMARSSRWWHYRAPAGAPKVVPLYSAHNTCDGDINLGWDVGQLVRVSGSDTIYEVVAERQAITGSDSGILETMPDEMALQTCFYGTGIMRLLALSPLSVTHA